MQRSLAFSQFQRRLNTYTPMLQNGNWVHKPKYGGHGSHIKQERTLSNTEVIKVRARV